MNFEKTLGMLAALVLLAPTSGIGARGLGRPDATFQPKPRDEAPAVDQRTERTPTSPSGSIGLSEIRIDQFGADTDEFFELQGPAGADLSGYSYVVIGDADTFPPTQNGSIEEVVELSDYRLDTNGLFVAAEETFSLGTSDLVTPLNFENSDNVTHLLVRDFQGAVGDDLDTDDDGVLDVTPWASVADCVALLHHASPDGNSDEFYYCDQAKGPIGGFTPSLILRCGTDGNWIIGDDDLGVDDTPGAANGCLDCNENGRSDEDDIADGRSIDCNANSVPDECDLSTGHSDDCDFNDVPDECDDCNANGVPDPDDLESGNSTDCNGTCRPDECDLDDGFSGDCNGDGIPDECDGSGYDCNGNGMADSDDIASGFSVDHDEDGIPDECEGPLDVVFVLDVTGSKTGPPVWPRTLTDIKKDLLAENSYLLQAIKKRSNGCARVGMVSFTDRVAVELPLTSDFESLRKVVESLGYPGGGNYPEASDRALLEVLLQGEAETCTTSSDDPCCEVDDVPGLCDLPPVCLETAQRFDVPFRQNAGRVVVHVTDFFPGGCDDHYEPSTDMVFAERIGQLAGQEEIPIISVADDAPASEAGNLYSIYSQGTLLKTFLDCPFSIGRLSQALLSIDLGARLGQGCLDCPADLDGNGVVDGADLTTLLGVWGTSDPAADLTGDGLVDGADLTDLLAAWGPCPQELARE